MIGVSAVAFAGNVCAKADELVPKWNEAFVAELAELGAEPAAAARALAMFHFAMWNAMARAQQVGLGDAEQRVAAAAAAEGVAKYFFPKSEMGMALDSDWQETQAGQIGAQCALELIASRRDDGSAMTLPSPSSEVLGKWRHTPPDYLPPELPQWGDVRPFTLRSVDPFLPPEPPELVSQQYADGLNEVKALGEKVSAARSREQTAIAIFWSDLKFTETPVGHWNSITRGLARDRELSFPDNVRLFATLNLAMADAGIVIWRAKYRYRLWRPIDAVRGAWDDGNSATEGDGEWTPLLPAPPHPEYPSGHAGFSGAAAEVLALFFGGDATTFTVTSPQVPGMERTYPSLWAAALEIAMSRVYCGIHYQFSGLAGLTSGRKVGETVWQACGEPRASE
ncbi:MAG: vanadium-dependent haloperoxidase [Chthoniobacterales bacterium]